VKRPVLILGWIPRIVITVARSLHSYGVQVDVADFTARSPIRSRAVQRFLRLPRPDVNPAEFASQLRSLITANGYDMLIPCDDQALATMLEHYEDFNALLHVACPPPHILRNVLSKSCSLDAARSSGIRVPKTVLVTNSAQLRDLAASIPFPWILKPAEKEKHEEETKSRLVKTASELEQAFPEPAEFISPLLLQEYCEGSGVGIEMLIHNGECYGAFQHRRLKELPYTGGYAVTALAEQLDPALFQSSLALLRTLNWEGVAMVEFKVNQLTGEPVFMEINGRYWGTLSLPVISGMNFPLYHWQLAHGEMPYVPANYAVGTKWRWTVGYVARLHQLFIHAWHSSAAREAFVLTLRQLPADFGFSMRDSLFKVTDPIPAIRELFLALNFLAWTDLKKLSARVKSGNLFV